MVKNECRRVLLIAQRAINNWICTYAPDQCSDEHVEHARAEIGKYGTLAYLAYVSEEISTLLACLSAEPAGAIPEPAPVQAEGNAVERKEWRIGAHYRIHLYAGETPLGTMLTRELAERVVADHNAALSATARAVDVEAGAQWLAKNVMCLLWDGVEEGACAPYPPWKAGGHYNAGREDYRIAVRNIIAAARAGNADVERETIERGLEALRLCQQAIDELKSTGEIWGTTTQAMEQLCRLHKGTV